MEKHDGHPRPCPRFRVVLFLLLNMLLPLSAVHAEVKNVKQTNLGFSFTCTAGMMELQAYGDSTIRVLAAPGSSMPIKKSLVVINAAQPAPWRFRDDGRSLDLTIGGLTASVDKQSELLTFSNAEGKTILQQSPGGVSLKPATQPSRDDLQVSETFARDPGERFFGMGVIHDELSQPTAKIHLLNNNTQIQLPLLYSTRGYGVLWDNASEGELDLTPTTVSWQSSAGDLIDYYVMAGPSADQVIAQYRALTGQAPMFAKWAYGFWFCKNRFKSQDEILNASSTFRRERIPVDLIIQDYYYWEPTKAQYPDQNWGSHEFDPQRYPDPKGMITELHDQYHFHFMAVVWPKFDPATDHAKELAAANALFPTKPSAYYDPFITAGREIYGRQVMESLLPLGVDAFWVDAAEPEIDKRKFAAFDSPAGPVSRFMNAFPLMHTTALHDAMRAATDKRVLLLPRSSWAGMQRNGACNWTGDIKGDWKTLEWQIRGLQNYSIAGLPYITTDIGGYAPTAESTAEHFLRWYEWGSFCPIFRVHGDGRALPWDYGPDAEAIMRKINDLHYRLMPYIYSNAANVTKKAGTIMRPLVMDFAGDAKAVETWDQFMYGPQLLVCPAHESRFETTTISPEQFADPDGKAGGLRVTYTGSGTEKPGWVRMSASCAFARPADYKKISSIRYEGSFTPKESGSLFFTVLAKFGDGKLTLNGKSFTGAPFQHIQVPVEAKAGEAIRFAFDTTDPQAGFAVLADRFGGGMQTRSVYLPAGSKWYDFWTGQEFDGGQTVSAEAPLDRIPLYVRGGAVLPMGPTLQYADEHPADPIELRVYPGADGSFTLYEDEGDGYAYEKGVFATIPISWNEKSRTLVIGDRQGTFPGMLVDRTFRVVWVKPSHGSGIDPAQASDLDLKYSGKAISIPAPAN